MFQNHPVYFKVTTGRTMMATIARSHAMTFSKVVSGASNLHNHACRKQCSYSLVSSVVPRGKLTSLEQQQQLVTFSCLDWDTRESWAHKHTFLDWLQLLGTDDTSLTYLPTLALQTATAIPGLSNHCMMEGPKRRTKCTWSWHRKTKSWRRKFSGP